MTDTKRLSKTLSYWLRHRPDEAGLTLDGAGWADVRGGPSALATKGLPGDRATLDRVLDENDKQRFEYSPDGLLDPRAARAFDRGRGAWEEREPPAVLFHGTVGEVSAGDLR